MKQYTVVLRRSSFLLDIYDEPDFEFYIANPIKFFEGVPQAAKAAKLEAAKADRCDVHSILRERGVASVFNSFHIDPDNYEVVMVFEGRPKVLVTGPDDLLVKALNRN